MKFVLIVLPFLLAITDPAKIGKVNTLKSEAKKSYLEGNYPVAIRQYKQLIDSLNINEDEVKLNLAHAYYQSKDTTNAISAYQNLTASTTNAYKSIANQQLGVIKNQQGNLEEALTYFKQAIKADPAN
nr:tetratricopeptide repeat protein [Cyclobacteriaceae bacterium]